MAALVPMTPEVTMARGLEVSTRAMASQASTQELPAMAPAPLHPRAAPRQVSRASCPLVTLACGWRGQEERPLAMAPGPLTPEDRHRAMALMAPATMAPATLPATPQPLASIQEGPPEARVIMAPLAEDLVTAPSRTVITIPLVTADPSPPMWRPRGLMVSPCTTRPASSQHCPSHLTTPGDGKHPRGTTAR